MSDDEWQSDAYVTRQYLDSVRPTSPTTYMTFSNQTENNNKVHALQCAQMDCSIECFMETAIINMSTNWKNKTDEYINCLFVIPIRGSVTDCTVYIGQERVRTINLIDKKQFIKYNIEQELEEEIVVNTTDETNENDSSQHKNKWVLQSELFMYQIPGYFRIPFSNIKPQQEVKIDIEYTETLRIHRNAYYLTIPIKLDNATMPETNKWSDIIHLKATIHHPPDKKITVVSQSHKLAISKMAKKTIVEPIDIKIPNKGKKETVSEQNEDVKDNEISISEIDEEKLKTYGNDFIFQYRCNDDIFNGYLIDEIDDKSEVIDSTSCNVLLSSQDQCSSFKRSVLFLIDRSSRSSFVWKDIVKSVEYSLERLDETEEFNIMIFDQEPLLNAEGLMDDNELFQKANDENKMNAIEWLTCYKPEYSQKKAFLPTAFLKASKLLKNIKSLTFPVLVFIATSNYDEYESNATKVIGQAGIISLHTMNATKQLITNLQSTILNDFSFRIFCVGIGNAVNPYFLHYLSSITRGKSIHLTNPQTIFEEMSMFFNEFRDPVLTDITVNVDFFGNDNKFDSKTMLYPYPISDLYESHPVLLKLIFPKKYKIKQVVIKGHCANVVNEAIEIPVLRSDDYYDNENENEQFPMNVVLAQSHLNYLHSNLWFYDKNDITSDSDLEINKFENKKYADHISEMTGLSSPTKIIQSIEISHKIWCDIFKEYIYDDQDDQDDDDGDNKKERFEKLLKKTYKRIKKAKKIYKKAKKIYDFIEEHEEEFNDIYEEAEAIFSDNPFGGNNGDDIFGFDFDAEFGENCGCCQETCCCMEEDHPCNQCENCVIL